MKMTSSVAVIIQATSPLCTVGSAAAGAASAAARPPRAPRPRRSLHRLHGGRGRGRRGILRVDTPRKAQRGQAERQGRISFLVMIVVLWC
jgi:hypothetical protein